MARFARVALGASFAALACVAILGEQAQACGGGDFYGITELTTFDPKVLGDPINDGLYYDPFIAGYQGACEACANPVLADWNGYLKGAILPADWEKILYQATPSELTAIGQKLAGKAKAAPKGYEQSSIWKTPAAADKLRGAIEFVQLAREVEGFSSFEAYDADGNAKPTSAPPDDLLATARAGSKSKDRFLAQRYAFQAVRVLFYRRDWAGTVAFVDKNASLLASPSDDLAWNARLYAAGALSRDGKRARANLELARIHANYPPLSATAANDFRPAEETDWRASLKLAKTAREKTELWRLVGIKNDGVVAMQEILKLDPKSPLIGLLLVRELAHAESRGMGMWGEKPEPSELEAQKKAYATLEKIALDQIARGGDKPWLMELVAGHIAAKRGDLAAARAHLGRATAAKPGDAAVASQAKASLALALVANWKIGPAYEQELATTVAGLDPSFGRADSVRSAIRSQLAGIYAKAGQIVDAEFLLPGTVEPYDPYSSRPTGAKSKWDDVGFIQQMITRAGKTTTPFDKFVVGSSFTIAGLQQDLASRYLLDGDFATAAKGFAAVADPGRLGTDPFVMHVVDCHDCDHDKYANASWTRASLAKKLAELEKTAKGNGEAAAQAAMQLGSALYNISYHGNARTFLENTHQVTGDTSLALRWYKRAYELSKNRDFKARAAYYAAKAELGNLITQAETANPDGTGTPQPLVPTTWFAVLKQYNDTKYYRQVLRECGYFSDWLKH
ncbi:MAG: hypothetical protein K8W52_32080 [Deltaproteobacteria bacterium]|nr:hypothetical protein [Deltaproteobacteria bacterium]